jgi:hypothetical protein
LGCFRPITMLKLPKIAVLDDAQSAAKNLGEVVTNRLSQPERLALEGFQSILTEDVLEDQIEFLAAQECDLIVFLDLGYVDSAREWPLVSDALSMHRTILSEYPTLVPGSSARQGLTAALLLARARQTYAFNTLIVVASGHIPDRDYAVKALPRMFQAECLAQVAVEYFWYELAKTHDGLFGSCASKIIDFDTAWPGYFVPLLERDDGGRITRVLQRLAAATAVSTSARDRTRWTHAELESLMSVGVITLNELFASKNVSLDTNGAKALMQCTEPYGIHSQVGPPPRNFQPPRKYVSKSRLEAVLTTLGLDAVQLQGDEFLLPETPGLPFLLSLSWFAEELRRNGASPAVIEWKSKDTGGESTLAIRLAEQGERDGDSVAYSPFGLRDRLKMQRLSQLPATGVTAALTHLIQCRLGDVRAPHPIARLFRGWPEKRAALSADPDDWPPYTVMLKWPNSRELRET